MTIDISANLPRISYTVAAGVTQTSFTVPFEFFDDSDLNVYIDQVLQTITTNYTVTGGSGSTGTVTMTVTGAKTVIITRDTTIERTTDFTAGVDINRAALNTQLDTLTAIAADNKDFIERSIRIKDFDPTTASLELPDATTRANKLLSFDTEGGISVQAASDLLAGSVLGANYTKASYTSNGSTTAYSTVEAAGSKNNIQVYIDGVYQNKDTFSISGTTLTFTEAPPLNSAIEFIVGNAITSLTTDPDVVTYNQGGTGAQDRTLTSRLQDFVSVKDFGAVGDGVADDTAAIQAALDASKGIYLPKGEYKITSTLYYNDQNYIKGDGRASQITYTGAASCIAGKNVTPASGTNVRRYDGGGMNFRIYGPSTGGSSCALDMRGCTAFKWDNLLIQNFHTGIKHGDNYSSYYNEYRAVDISTVTYGIYNDTLGNENIFTGGRVNDCSVGTFDSDNSHNKYIGVAIEVISTAAHKIDGATAQQIQYIASRVENTPSSAIGFDINSNAQDTQIMFPQLIGMSTDISDAGLRTNIIASEYWKIAGGTRIKTHQKVTQAIDFPSIPAGSTNDQLVTISGSLATDSVFVTTDANIGTGLMVMAIPASGGVYVRMANVTSGAIDPPSLTFTIDIWRHG